jgi:hypothetical protein
MKLEGYNRYGKNKKSDDYSEQFDDHVEKVEIESG